MPDVNLSDLLGLLPTQTAAPTVPQTPPTSSVPPSLGGWVSPGSAQAAVPKDQVQALAKQMSDQLFGPDQFGALQQLVNNESGWRPDAANPTSSARGLFQFLGSTAKAYGLPEDATQASPAQQISAGLKYIQSRYGSPQAALQFWNETDPSKKGGIAGHWY